MQEYEQITDNCKILWKKDYKITTEKHTQVSGYIFNNKKEILIVKNGKIWTIPGGHPKIGESAEETLTREIMEESCVTIKNINYLGAVEVIENNKKYYQIRYTAKVNEILQFNAKWEISERKFVDLKDLHKYIKWSQGIAFSKQIESARKFWGF